MSTITRNHRTSRFITTPKGSLLAISATATGLILWLTISFWYDAYLQRIDAARLQQITRYEDTLFVALNALATERQQSQLALTASAAIDPKDAEQVTIHRIRVDRALDGVLYQLSQSTGNSSIFPHYAHTPAVINDRLAAVSRYRNALMEHRVRADRQFRFADSARDDRSRAAIFGALTDVIDAIHSLSRSIRFVPQRADKRIASITQLKAAAWDMSEAASRDTAWLVGSLRAQASQPGSPATRQNIDLQQREVYRNVTPGPHQARHDADTGQVTLAWRTISAYALENMADASLVARIDKINKTHFADSQIRRSALIQARQNGDITAAAIKDWLAVADLANEALNSLAYSTAARTLEIAGEIEAHAVRRLLIDTLLLFVCIAIVIASHGLLRKIHYQAYHDGLTDLPNRFRFEQLLERAVLRSTPEHRQLAVIFLNLDGFKAINDTLGHGLGDELLKHVSRRLLSCLKTRDVLARLGGDEFAVIVQDAQNPNDVEAVATRLLDTLLTEFTIAGVSVEVSASFGVSFFPQNGATAADLLKHASIAMHQAKDSGKRRVQCFSQVLAEQYQRRIQTELDLKKAIENQQFELYYQPQVDPLSGCVGGVEALIRWHHPERGLVSPFEFIPIAESSGLMTSIGAWVLDEACCQAARWHRMGHCELQVAVNISVQQFAQPDFVELVYNTVNKHQLDAKYLELEVTESIGMIDVQQVVETLNQLRRSNIKIAIDDFGTDYSSLQYLEDLPLDVLKIDRAFVNKLGKSERGDALIRTIVVLAKSLRLATVAEGVETREQLAEVVALGCDSVQGYYYSKPVPASELPATIAAISAASGHFRQAG